MTGEYKRRIADKVLTERLQSMGVVVVEGAKWCGKTTTCDPFLNRFQIFIATFVVVVGTFAFFSNPFAKLLGVDSSIFYYVAERLRDGALPYRDVFDQKGVLMYLIDSLACANVGKSALSGTWCWAAWLLDVVAYAVGLSLSCLCAVKATERRSTHVMPVVVSVLVLYYQFVSIGGNMPEMWILVFSAVAYWYVLVSFRLRELSWRSSFLIGLCVGCVFFLKLNMITVAVPALWVSWLYGRNKIVGMALGFLSVVLPVAVWYGQAGALDSFYEVYFQYNATYAFHAGRGPQFTLAAFPAAFLVLLNAYGVLVEREKPLRTMLAVNLAYLAVTWLAILLSGGGVRYYCPILLPCAIPLAWSFLQMKHRLPHGLFSWGMIVLCGGCAVVMALFVILRNSSLNEVKACHSELRQLGNVICDRSSVTVMGCDCYAYMSLGATCPGRFPFQGTVAGRSEKYKEDMLRDLRSQRSRYLVVPDGVLEKPGELGVTWAKTTIADNYRRIAGCKGYVIYERRGLSPEGEK